MPTRLNIFRWKKTCKQCERTLNKNSFGKNQWKRKDKTSIRCKDCTLLTTSPPRKKLKSGILIKASKTMIDTNVKINDNNEGEDDKGKTSSSNSNSDSYSDSISRETQNDKDSKLKVTKKKTKKKDEKKKCKKEELGPELIKIKLIDRINVLSDSERKLFQLEWTSLAISESDEKIVADNVVVKGWYGPMDANELLQMRDHVKSTEMTVSQAISLRSAYLQQKGMYRHEVLRKQARKLYRDYKQGCNILDLAKKCDNPPMNVFRTMLAEMKWSKIQIKTALRDPQKFEKREREEFLAAESSDVVSMVNQVEIHKNAEIFEDVLSAWLEKKGIRFVRQKQLETEQKEEFGSPVLTPDFLLLDSVIIDGISCHWIDCKAFYGCNLQFSIKKTKKQMTRYINHWGSGAIVYLQGFSEAIKIPNCVLLNAYGALDVDILSHLEEKNCAGLNKVATTVFDNTKEK